MPRGLVSVFKKGSIFKLKKNTLLTDYVSAFELGTAALIYTYYTSNLKIILWDPMNSEGLVMCVRYAHNRIFILFQAISSVLHGCCVL